MICTAKQNIFYEQNKFSFCKYNKQQDIFLKEKFFKKNNLTD